MGRNHKSGNLHQLTHQHSTQLPTSTSTTDNGLMFNTHNSIGSHHTTLHSAKQSFASPINLQSTLNGQNIGLNGNNGYQNLNMLPQTQQLNMYRHQSATDENFSQNLQIINPSSYTSTSEINNIHHINNNNNSNNSNNFRNQNNNFTNNFNNKNHNCMWRQSYEDEHQMRIEQEQQLMQCLQKLEQEREMKMQLESDLQEMKERLQYLEQRNTYLQGELKQQNSANKRITFCAGISQIKDEASSIEVYQSPDVNFEGPRSMSPRQTQHLFTQKLSLIKPNSNITNNTKTNNNEVYQSQELFKQQQQQPINITRLRSNSRNMMINNNSNNNTGNNSLEEENDMRNIVNIQVMKNQQVRNSSTSQQRISSDFQRGSTVESYRNVLQTQHSETSNIKGVPSDYQLNDLNSDRQMTANTSHSQNRSVKMNNNNNNFVSYTNTAATNTNTTDFNTINTNPNHNRIESQTYQGLSIDYIENDPTSFNIDDSNSVTGLPKLDKKQKNQALRKFKSGDNQFFVQQQQQQQNVDQTPSQSCDINVLKSQQFSDFQHFHNDTTTLQQNNTQFQQTIQLQNQFHKDNIKQILGMNKTYNLGFSRFKMMQLDESGGQLQAIRLRQDPIRIAQHEYFAKLKREMKKQNDKKVAKSMQFNENVTVNKLHQIQPSHMLRKESIDQKYQNLQITSSLEFDNTNTYPPHQHENEYDYYNSNNNYNNDDDVIMEIEEDDVEFVDSSGRYQNTHRFQHQQQQQVNFQNEEIMMYQSPKDKRMRPLPSQLDNFNLYIEDDHMLQTQRIMEDQNTIDKHLLLETPVQKIGGGGPISLNDKIKETYRAAEYSDNQKKEMEKSIINRSTNKKLGRRQKFIATATIKLEKKNIESFRESNQQQNTIQEEAKSQNHSDDEQEMQKTPTEQKDKSNLSLGESKLIKNPTYARITHASKQMEFLGQFRLGGMTMMGGGGGQRNEQSNSIMGGNPLLKSMPNLNLLKQIEKSPNTLPFDEVSERLQASGLQHSSTLLDINQSSILLPSKINKPNNFGTPIQNVRSTNNLFDKHQFNQSPLLRHTIQQRLFEEFFIIGVDQTEVNAIDWTKSTSQYVTPKTLYMYSNQSEEICERRRVVKDFCFPDGVEVRKVKSKGETLTEKSKAIFSKILYQTKNLRESCFIFTMNANEDGQSDNNSLTKSRNNNNHFDYQETFPEGGIQEKYYNCICVILNELISDTNFEDKVNLNENQLEKGFNDAKIFSAKKAYCFMFSNHFYQLHLETINLLTNVVKDNCILTSSNILSSQTLNLMKNFSPEKVIKIQLLRDVFAHLQQQLINQDMLLILDKYYTLDIEMQNDQIILEFSQEIGQLKYDLPSITEVPFLEHSWFCPQLFQLFSAQQFLQLLSAVLIEKSIIFVGKANLVSSTILGLNCLLNPFKWCFALVPILPHPLIDMIEAPVPLLVGITKREYRELNLTQEERDSKIWVFVENGEIIWNKDNMPRNHFYFDDLLHKIDSDYSSFSKDLFKITNQSHLLTQDEQSFEYTLESARSSFVQDIALVFNDKQKAKCRNICITIRQALKKYILESLKSARQNRQAYKGDNLAKEMGDIVVKNSAKQDKAFLSQFVETQMFTTYIEEFL